MELDLTTVIEILAALGTLEVLKKGLLLLSEEAKHRFYGMKYLSKLYSDTFDVMTTLYNTEGVDAVALVRCKNGGKLLKNDTDIIFEPFVPNLHEKGHEIADKIKSLKPTFELLSTLKQSFSGLTYKKVDDLPFAYYQPVIDRGRDFIFLVVPVRPGLPYDKLKVVQNEIAKSASKLASIVK